MPVNIIRYFVLFVVLSCKLAAQDSAAYNRDNTDVQLQLEAIAETYSSEENDYTNLIEALEYYRAHPININNTNAEELHELGLLNTVQINNLLNHIAKNGKLIVIYELQTIEGFSLKDVERLLPYVFVSDKLSQPHYTFSDVMKQGNHTLMLRFGQVLEQQRGFAPIDSATLHKSPNSRYVGSPQKLYTRYNFNFNNTISCGITAEKDQGELFFKKNAQFNYNGYPSPLNNNIAKGFDFYSAHVFVKNAGIVKSFAAGDYQLSFGQGLAVWTGFAFGKSYNNISIKKNAQGIRPYKSVDENKFMRGTAVTMKYGKVEVTAFLSHKKIDGNISDSSSSGETTTISSLQETGSHATPAEIYDKHAVTQTIYGGNVTYRKRNFNMGITAVNYLLDKELARNDYIYNRFEFSGKHNFNVGIDYNYVFKNFNFFGEQAICKNGSTAFINGILISLDARLSVCVVHRNYQRSYQNLISNALSQNSSNANEKGVYAGLNIQLSNSITAYVYYDRFEFPWLKYQVNAPSYGNEFLMQLNYKPSKKLESYVRFRSQEKQKNATTGNNFIDSPLPLIQNNFRINISYHILTWLKLQNRIELTNYTTTSSSTERGYLAYQDIIYKKLKRPLSVTLRYAVFQTDSYDARIYAYENDMQGYYSLPAYYYRGTRFYIMLNYRVSKNMELWMRYSQTYYDDRNIISEGSLNEIMGNSKSEVRAQMLFTF